MYPSLEIPGIDKWQIQSKGQVGYSTGKHASPQAIHPFKRRKTLEANVSNLTTVSSSVASDSSESNTNSCETSEDSFWKHQQTQESITLPMSQGSLLQAQSYQPIEQ